MIPSAPTTTSSGDGHHHDEHDEETLVHDQAMVPLPSADTQQSSTTIMTKSNSSGSLLMMSVRDRMLQRHDSVFSVSSEYYEDASDNDLNMWQGAALLTADCLGTGLLALPEDIQVLGRWVGLTFLILNLPINLYAGTILSDSAAHVERVQAEENDLYEQRQQEVMRQQEIQQDNEEGDEEVVTVSSKDGLMKDSPNKRKMKKKKSGGSRYLSVEQTDENDNDQSDNNNPEVDIDQDDAILDRNSENNDDASVEKKEGKTVNPHKTVHHDTATFDLIGMTQALFSSRTASRAVTIIFYTNIFLVLGDYILVMSHAVSALVGEEVLCLPQAGIMASTLMYAVTQTRTMANLGRAASIISLSALAIVVIQCLWAVYLNKDDNYVEASPEDFDHSPSLLRKFAALGSIGFATGSQKLFLNIRHELKDRSKGPQSLAVSLSAFGTVYVGIVLLAGFDPPGFLFDAISPGWNRRLAGLLLWIHVVVSYAINSQAICSSMDRLYFGNIQFFDLNSKPRLRWMCLTGIISIMAFLVANAVPFFKDLVALIGALTSIPLALLFPAIFFRRYLQVPIWTHTRQTLGSYLLLAFSLGFMAVALAGSISSIDNDWKSKLSTAQSGPFSCH